MCMSCNGSFTYLSYNTSDGDKVSWNQYGAIDITINSNMKSCMTYTGSDSTKLGRWIWVRMEDKAGEATVFITVHYPCKNMKGMFTMWNQYVHYFQREKDIEKPDIHALFIKDLCKEL